MAPSLHAVRLPLARVSQAARTAVHALDPGVRHGPRNTTAHRAGHHFPAEDSQTWLEHTRSTAPNPDLARALTRAQDGVDLKIAGPLMTCAAYAYSDNPAYVAEMASRAGLGPDLTCAAIHREADAMLINSTVMLLHSPTLRLAILAYRGTPPTDPISWAADFDIFPDTAAITINDVPYPAHDGFVRNTHATYDLVLERLADLPDLDHLYVTGHSLGAAMAAVFGIELLTDESPAAQTLQAKMRAIYAFAQPMIASPDLAAAARGLFEQANLPYVRFNYRHDIVPHWPAKDSGTFAHFGEQRSYHTDAWEDTTNHPAEQIPYSLELLDGPLSLLGLFIRSLGSEILPYSLADHLPKHYIAALSTATTATDTP